MNSVKYASDSPFLGPKFKTPHLHGAVVLNGKPVDVHLGKSGIQADEFFSMNASVNDVCFQGRHNVKDNAKRSPDNLQGRIVDNLATLYILDEKEKSKYSENPKEIVNRVNAGKNFNMDGVKFSPGNNAMIFIEDRLKGTSVGNFLTLQAEA